MAETLIESFCENLLMHRSEEDYKLGSDLNETADTAYNNEINGNTGNNGNNEGVGIGGEGNRGGEEGRKSPPLSWIRTVFLVAIEYAEYAAVLLILFFLLLCIIRLTFVPNNRERWAELVLEPIVSILLCLFPLSFSLPMGLLIVESATTAGFLATSEVILKGDCTEKVKINESGKRKYGSETNYLKKNTGSAEFDLGGEDLGLGSSCDIVNNPLTNNVVVLNGRNAGKYDESTGQDEIPARTNSRGSRLIGDENDEKSTNSVKMSALSNAPNEAMSTICSTAGGKYTNRTVVDDGEFSMNAVPCHAYSDQKYYFSLL